MILDDSRASCWVDDRYYEPSRRVNSKRGQLMLDNHPYWGAPGRGYSDYSWGRGDSYDQAAHADRVPPGLPSCDRERGAEDRSEASGDAGATAGSATLPAMDSPAPKGGGLDAMLHDSWKDLAKPGKKGKTIKKKPAGKARAPRDSHMAKSTIKKLKHGWQEKTVPRGGNQHGQRYSLYSR